MQKLTAHVACALLYLSYSTHTYAGYPQQWDLANSLDEALRQSPQLQATLAEIEARKTILDEAGNWPNPEIEIAVDDSVSLEQNSSGYAFSELSVSQAMPLGRLDANTRQASLSVDVAVAAQRYQILQIERTTADAYFTLQYYSELLQLAQQRFESLGKMLTRDNDPLVRYISDTEKKRLNILREEAHQEMSAAEGEYLEAESVFKTLLALPEELSPVTEDLTAVPTPGELTTLLTRQKQHPLLQTLLHARDAAEAGIEVSRAERLIDPQLKLFTTRDMFAGREQTSTGIAVNFEIPLWQNSSKEIARAKADAQQQQTELELQRRELKSALRKSHLHLQHLIEQALHYRDHILQPAQEILQLSRRGFRSGEIDLLNFIDAHNTYYEARHKHLDRLYDGWLETTDLRFSAGVMMTEIAR